MRRLNEDDIHERQPGTWNEIDGAELWHSADGTTWEVIVGEDGARYPSGFGQANIGLVSLAAAGGRLFLGTTNMAGGQLWASDDGVTWRCIVGPDAPMSGGFGSSETTSLFSLRAFNGSLCAGVRNGADGGAIWRLELEAFSER